MDDFLLDAQPRKTTGRAANKRLRRTGWVPAIIYGGNGEPLMISLEHNDLNHHLHNEAFFSHIIKIKIDGGKTEEAILRDLHRHPARPFVEHADFQRVVADEALRMSVPLHFAGEEECPGVVDENGIVQHNITEIEIECLPRHLPEYIEIDCSQLNVNDTLHMSDLKVPANVSIVDLMGEEYDEESDRAVVTVGLPRAEVEEEPEVEDESAEEGEGAEDGEESSEEGDNEGDTKSEG